jgi:hypothetical protein
MDKILRTLKLNNNLLNIIRNYNIVNIKKLTSTIPKIRKFTNQLLNMSITDLIVKSI